MCQCSTQCLNGRHRRRRCHAAWPARRAAEDDPGTRKTRPSNNIADALHIHGADKMQLSTNADKKNVCAASKRLQTLITPSLYYRMELGSAQLKKRFLHTLESPGLSHVRILSILSLSEAQVNILCRLIFALPKNALTRFEYVHSSLPTVSMHLLTRYRIPTFYLSSVGIQCALRLRQ